MKRLLTAILLASLLMLCAFAESGDVNADGKENMLDTIMIAKEISRETEETKMDINGDGVQDLQDMLIHLHRIVNAKPILPDAIDSGERILTIGGGSWSYTGGILTGNNTTAGDCFAMTDIYVPGGTAFTLETTIQMPEGGCAGIVFGVPYASRPSSGWYCVNIDFTNKKTRLFSVNIGTVGTASVAQRPLTAEELAKDTHALRLSVTEGGVISWWLDGTLVASYEEPGFAGGYIGFNTWKSKAVFRNLSVQIGESGFPKQSIYTAVSGRWGFGGGVLHGQNAAFGDAFAMTGICVPSDTAFTVEATCDLLAGSKAGGIVFGVADPQKPASGWYCANLTMASKSARIFSVKTGTIGSASDTYHALSESALATAPYRLRLEVTASGKISYYVNGELAVEVSDPNFAGGYIGFNTWKTDATYSDIVITVGEKSVPISGSALIAGEKRILLNPAASYQKVDIGEYSGEITVALEIPEGYSAAVGTTPFADGKYTFTPNAGLHRLQIDLRDKYARKTSMTVDVLRDASTYTDTYRPLLHITAPRYILNDPNGLHYNSLTKEYHAYYQWREQYKFGNDTWRHAVSTDLLHWEDHGVVLAPDKTQGGWIWSGSAVIDKDNTSGLFADTVAPENRLVVFYTRTNYSDVPFGQEMAYSTDGGYTFTKYAGNPVIPSSAYYAAFRDPKVQWIEEKGLWLMVVAGGPAEIYTSPDLIHWTSHGLMTYSDGTRIESECPMLLRLPLDGDENNVKYVYVGSGRFYVVGDLVWEGNSVRFVPEQEKVTGLFDSGVHYATQDFYNDAKGRTLVMSWMQDYTYQPGKYWMGFQSLPYETTLVTDGDRMVLHFAPIDELDAVKRETLYSASDITLNDSALDMENVHTVCSVLDLRAKLSAGASLTLDVRVGDGCKTALAVTHLSENTVSVTMDASVSGVPARTVRTATVTTDADGYFALKMLIDNSILEAFTSDGHVFADFIFPYEGADGMSLQVNGEAHIASFTVSAAE
ncbi:MAG: GH32 C-terminal domain-containing protein [Clostridia bacterium]|nr:GH32 C-terminal domain-containing protein [Clostridia bacterium]